MKHAIGEAGSGLGIWYIGVGGLGRPRKEIVLSRIYVRAMFHAYFERVRCSSPLMSYRAITAWGFAREDSQARP